MQLLILVCLKGRWEAYQMLETNSQVRALMAEKQDEQAFTARFTLRRFRLLKALAGIKDLSINEAVNEAVEAWINTNPTLVAAINVELEAGESTKPTKVEQSAAKSTTAKKPASKKRKTN